MFSGVPCSAHIWLARGSTGKSRQDLLGDQTLGFITRYPVSRQRNGGPTSLGFRAQIIIL